MINVGEIRDRLDSVASDQDMDFLVDDEEI